MKILVTGTAGFIGFHTSRVLLNKEHKVIGFDNINEYYDPDLKNSHLKILKQYPNLKFHKKNL
tara:strand:+ start:241 stop:429 length:189 start_codon:yes stop_codon:yes gene_type:complete